MKIEDVQSSIQKALPEVALKTVRESLLIENPADLVKVAEYLKDCDQFRLDFLSSVTGADYLEFLESVYHLYSVEKKIGPVTLRVRVKKENPKVPSLVPVYRGAEYQERDAFDLYGIEYENHPDLRRILMWEGFEGFPMRKDYVQEDSESLDEEDIAWLAARQVEVPQSLRKKEDAQNQEQDGDASTGSA